MKYDEMFTLAIS